MERNPMQKLNDLSRSLTPLKADGTLIAVIEMSLSSWLVAGIVPGIERQPLKKLDVDENALLKLLNRWRWRGPDVFPWLQCRNEEWVRRLGASLPMRITASWFGSLDPPDTRLWRDLSRPNAGSPLIVIPIAPNVLSCSKLSRCGLATAS